MYKQYCTQPAPTGHLTSPSRPPSQAPTCGPLVQPVAHLQRAAAQARSHAGRQLLCAVALVAHAGQARGLADHQVVLVLVHHLGGPAAGGAAGGRALVTYSRVVGALVPLMMVRSGC